MFDIIYDIIAAPDSYNISSSTIINICGVLIILFAVVAIDWIKSIFINR